MSSARHPVKYAISSREEINVPSTPCFFKEAMTASILCSYVVLNNFCSTFQILEKGSSSLGRIKSL